MAAGTQLDAPSPTIPSGDAGAVRPSEGGSRHPRRAMLVSGWVPSQTEPRGPSREGQGGAWLYPNSETGLRQQDRPGPGSGELGAAGLGQQREGHKLDEGPLTLILGPRR